MYVIAVLAKKSHVTASVVLEAHDVWLATDTAPHHDDRTVAARHARTLQRFRHFEQRLLRWNYLSIQ